MSSAALIVAGSGVLVGLLGLATGLLLARRGRSSYVAERAENSPARSDEATGTESAAPVNGAHNHILRGPGATHQDASATLRDKIAPSGAGLADGGAADGGAVGPELSELSPQSIVVMGASTPTAIAVVRSLRTAGHKVIVGDVDPHAAGMMLGDASGVIAPVSDPGFVASVCALGLRTRSNLLVPTASEQVLPLISRRSALEAAGLAAWLPTAESSEICLDRWRLAQVLNAHGIPFAPTALAGVDGVPGPWVVKPRFGSLRPDQYVVADAEDDVQHALARVPDPMVQTRLAGREIIVDALVSREGVLSGAVPRWRWADGTGGPAPDESTFADAGLMDALEALFAAIRIEGQVSVLGSVDTDSAITFLEVNPHFSDGVQIAAAAGSDLVGEYVRGVLGLPIRPQRLQFRPDVRMSRFLAEVCSEPDHGSLQRT